MPCANVRLMRTRKKRKLFLINLSRAMAAKLPPYEVQRKALTVSIICTLGCPPATALFLSRAIQPLKRQALLALRAHGVENGKNFMEVSLIDARLAELPEDAPAP